MGIKIIISVFLFVLGGAFASFAGVVAFRTPKGQSIVKPDSYCPSCKCKIKPYDNIPIFSYIFLGGKCRNCKARIGAFSFLCELFGSIGFASAYLMYGDSLKKLPLMLALICLVFLFLIMSAIDRETHEVYNVTLILFGVISALVVAYRVIALRGDLVDHLVGCALGFAFFLSISLIGKYIMKKDALGVGDIYIVGIGGFLLGAFQLLLSILLATLLGSIVELLKIKLGRSKRENEIAFAPYLLLGIGLMAIFGEEIMNFYWKVVL